MTQPGSGFGMGGSPGGYGGGSSDGPSILGGGGYVPAGGGYRPPKKKSSGGIAALVVVAVLLLGGIIALMVALVWKKGDSIAVDPSTLPAKQTSVAYKHLPTGCEIVARGDLAQMREVPAMKTHLQPMMDEMQQKAATDPDAKNLDEFLRAAGIDAKTDIKDVAACLKGFAGADGQEKFVMVVGGELRPETVVAAWEKVDRRTRDKPVVAKLDGRMVGRARADDGDTIIVGQAADGAIVLSNDETLFAGATKETSLHQSEYALPTNAEVAVTVGSAMVQSALAQGGPNPFLKDVSAVTRIVGTASLAQARVDLRVSTTSPSSAKSLLEIYNLMLGPLMKQELGRHKGKAPGVDILMNAKPSVEGNDFVLTAQGTPADVEAAARELARIVREESKKGLDL